MSVQTYVLTRAWVAGAVRDDVLVEVVDGRFTRVVPDSAPSSAPAGVARIGGLALPGLANTHSHVFHRALRGRTQTGRGSFWTWREQMYALAGGLDPDLLHALARATYAEMLAAGITCVGEFHYLHHRPDGRAYADPHAMGEAVLAAAAEVGIRITLLDTAYLAGGFGREVEGVQRRFADADADDWAARVADLRARDAARGAGVRIGTAIHSVRAVPPDQLATVAGAGAGSPRHVHLSEQVAENEECLAATGMTPTALLAGAGAWDASSTAVHATHLTGDDVATLAATGAHVSLCPTTERDLADGIGPAAALAEAGVPLTLGSDSHAVVDLFEEMRAVELDERLASRRRGHFTAAALLEAATATGHRSLGWEDAGTIAVGHRADLVVLDTVSPRTAGTGVDEQTAVFAASAADVRQVMVDGRWRVQPGDGRRVGQDLEIAVGRAWAAAQ